MIELGSDSRAKATLVPSARTAPTISEAEKDATINRPGRLAVYLMTAIPSGTVSRAQISHSDSDQGVEWPIDGIAALHLSRKNESQATPQQPL